MPIIGTIDSAKSGNLYAASYDSIASTVVGAGGLSSVTFSSIPSGYTHLQIRYTVRSRFAAGTDIVLLRVNGDNGNNYAAHRLYGDSSSVGANGFVPQSYLLGPDVPASTAAANNFGVGFWDILDYGNPNKNTTTRALGGRDMNSVGGNTWLNSALWVNTAAVTSVQFFCGNAAMEQGSTISLYGIKVA